ncbi:MAG TPA: sensor histidine kinase, partial [Magnetospirillum sp.]|nr:sensor histidine kinase [Magnetospirillum sp.]
GEDDLSEAYGFATQLAADLGQHLGLATADGQQLFNTRRPLGTPLPRRTEATSYRRALETERPSISNIVIGALTKQPLITIDVPAHTAKGPRVLGTSTDLSTIGAVLARFQLKPGWKAAVIDGEGRYIALTVNPEQHLGKPATPDIVAVAKSTQASGSLHNSLDGADYVSFFNKIRGTEWTVVVGIPTPELLAPFRGPLGLLAAAGAAAIALTVAFATLLGRRLYASAYRLTANAWAMGEGRELPPLSQTISEFEQVEAILHEADRQSRARQADLALAREAAERSVAAKNRFFAAASHDLRQPLHAAGWCIELLRQTTSDPKLTRYVDGLQQTHATMVNLISGLFDIAKMDAEMPTPTLAPVDLFDLTARVLQECRPVAEEKGLALRLRQRDGLCLTTDAGVLARILRNLVHNAIRYTENGGVLISCRPRRNALWIEVWDTGIGIAPDQVELIWEEFYRVDQSASAKGTGLGLAIVKRLVKSLDYRIEVRSTPGHGSLFRLVIPASAVAARPRAPVAQAFQARVPEPALP